MPLQITHMSVDLVFVTLNGVVCFLGVFVVFADFFEVVFGFLRIIFLITFFFGCCCFSGLKVWVEPVTWLSSWTSLCFVSMCV